ncbi:MAG: hypothetical protein ACOZQL_03560 [Myxococcota bacterium]
MRKTLTLATLTFALAFTGCEDKEKKAAEAKALAEKQAAEAKAAAEKVAAEAKAKAEKEAAELAAKAKEAMETQKKELLGKVTEALTAMDAKFAELKASFDKLPKAARAKAQPAIDAFEAAKTALTTAKTEAEGASEPSAFGDIATKVTAALEAAQKAMADAEAAVPAKKK